MNAYVLDSSHKLSELSLAVIARAISINDKYFHIYYLQLILLHSHAFNSLYSQPSAADTTP